jgi:hypothetical protein
MFRKQNIQYKRKEKKGRVGWMKTTNKADLLFSQRGDIGKQLVKNLNTRP